MTEVQDVVVLKNITKEYRGVPALRNINWSLRRGEIHALLGENGAGKSTLTKIIAGVTPPSHGELFVDGKATRFSGPGDALERGIAMVFQETNLVPTMTVAQNLYLGDEKPFNKLRKLFIQAQQFMQSLNFDVDPWATVSSLGAAKKQMVEIARAVQKNAEVIIFDEPTATLTPEEKFHFFALVRRLQARGVSIIFISHALEEALEIADRITILRDGELIRSAETAEFSRESIIRAMVGRELSEELYQTRGKVRAGGQKVLSVQNVSMGQFVRNTSFSVYAGQITGIFGLIGSGRSETAKIIAGAYKRNFFYGGEVNLFGKRIRYRIPRPGIKDGIVYVTEDRKLEGFFEHMSIAENVYINRMAADLEGRVFVNGRARDRLAGEWSRKLNIKALSASSKVIELSGGNQQKVVIAAALAKEPQLIIFDEPTRGVDVGAIADIHRLIRELADSGLGVVVISSYLPEVLNLSDRILVARTGRIVEEFDASDATEDKIMFAAVH
ncbi:sugar ABC transporter ATP-binding protein [Ochrobactrum sp. POC9]|uniref:sugar ABC transporter ATP-binding protein n=1 Tax=Ochrobactrum sp. POC9 TaxID=2203419 RepID=UPI000D7086CE|nr:sugar ABC transporter ATP-binding protein [Ochrobactrum sp. POC9]PWU70755.1 sugar ABC transporter ATP-binding protein [Ochrobactrum sp. POC9]